MSRLSTGIKTLLFLVLLACSLLPALQKRFGFFFYFPLNGAFYTTAKPGFSWKAWKSGEYQAQYEKYVTDSIGFKPLMVRFYNQIDFTLFSIPHAERVVVGKKDYLFEELYIKGVLGRDFKGRQIIDLRAKQLRELQDRLWRERNTLLVVVFAPDKGTFYEENIPGRFLKNPKTLSNYAYNVKKMADNGVNVVDFNAWFRKMKDTSRYVLYPKTGIHWSSYGALLAADSLARYLEMKLALKLPQIVIDSVMVSDTTRDRDADVFEGMNLLRRIPVPKMAYLARHYRHPEGSTKPPVLFIGDSFYFIWAYQGFIDSLFANNDFWYYNHDIYHGNNNTGRKVKDLDLLAETGRYRTIVIMQTNGGYGIMGYNFVDGLLNKMDSAELAQSKRSLP